MRRFYFASMRTLAIETTERIGSVAAFQGAELVAEARLTSDQRSAQSLAPALAELLKQLGWQAAEVDLIALTSGPGSFTGLRIGVTMAKTLAYAVGAEVLGVNTLEAIDGPADLTTGSNVNLNGRIARRNTTQHCCLIVTDGITDRQADRQAGLSGDLGCQFADDRTALFCRRK